MAAAARGGAAGPGVLYRRLVPESSVPASDGRTARTATVVGGGPAGLIAAETLARAGVEVTVYDRMPSVARKLLMAGHGGLNITHSEGLAAFRARYGAAAAQLAPMLDAFTPDALRAWCAGLGEEPFVGSSGRVFPRSFRATPLVRAWLGRLAELGVRIETRHTWEGWADPERPGGALRIVDREGGVHEVASDVVVIALGGASWPRLGSDGAWVTRFAEAGVAVSPLRAANVGVRVAWSDVFGERFEGAPLKNVGLAVRGGATSARGDLMVKRGGLEGGPVYALGPAVRAALDAGGCVLEMDLRPDLAAADVEVRLARRRPKESGTTWLRRTLGLDPVAVGLLREAGGGTLPVDPAEAAALVKAVPVSVVDTLPIDKAISTAGGIAWSEVDEHLMLRRLPGVFVAGEMLDWEAPTGGYLLQGCFATGVAAAHGALAWLGRGDGEE